MGQKSTLPNYRPFRLLLQALALVLFSVPAMAQMSAFITATPVNCNAQYGYASVTVTGTATPPFTYMWSNGLNTQNVVLGAGTYTVTVTDANGQTATASVTMTAPPTLDVEVVIENQICGLAPDGSASAIPIGGTPPFTYMWSNGGNTPQITGLPEGVYTVTVSDAAGCTVSAMGEVLFFDEGLWLMITPTNILCHGDMNGMMEVTPMSGTPPYTYSWSNGASTKKINNLSGGIYTVTVTDVNGCSAEIDGVVFEPPALFVTATQLPIGCDPGSGCVMVNVSGGTPPYSYLWNTGDTIANVCGVPAGAYTVTVTDAHNCTGTATVNLMQVPNTLSVTITPTGCAGCNPANSGSASSAVTGGSSMYSYAWDNGETTANATMLSAGLHSLTVTDNLSGCTATASVSIQNCPPLEVIVNITAQATCMIGGSATAVVTGGTAPYTYSWDGVPGGASVNGLIPGPHMVMVTDDAGCTATATFVVQQVDGPSVTATVINHASCLNNFLGSATATVTGGLPPYIYLWDNGETNATANLLSPGQHCVTVTDANGCAASDCVTINAAPTITPNINLVAAASCANNNIATFSVSVTGGTPPFNYNWSGGLPSTGTVMAGAGTYTVTVTDANSCTGTASITISPVPIPTVSIIATVNANCNSLGSATAQGAGGTPPYTYVWSNGATGATANNLAGNTTYTVTLTDAGGCTATATATIGLTTNGIKIGDYVWFDNDQDGYQDVQETGVNNVTVMLMQAGPDGVFGTADDVTVASTTTNSVGMYMFSCVTPGAYVLMFSGIPASYQWTGKDQVNNNCLDSDVNANGKTDPFTITSGQADDFCFDAGIHTTCYNVTYPGSICCAQTICEGEVPAAIVESSPAIGGSGQINYLWMHLVSVGQAPPTWMGIPGTDSPNYQPGPLFETTCFMRCVRRDDCPFIEGNVICITVLPAGSPGCVPFANAFNVKAISNHAVEISWETQTEAIQYMYTVEHSMDEQNWETLTTVMGKQNASGTNQYEYIHQTPLMGKNSYRIKRVNADGIESISEVRSIELDLPLTEAVAVYPNPVSNVLKIINMATFYGDVNIDLVSMDGKLVHSMVIPAGSIQQIEMTTESMPSGLYALRIRYPDGQVKTVKITKF